MSADSKRTKTPRWDRQISEQPFRVLARRFFITLGIILVLLYAGALVISRLPGFSYIIGEKLGDFTGLSARPARSWCDVGLNIFLEDLKSDPAWANHRGELAIKRVEMYWDRHGVGRVMIDQPSAVLRYRPGLGWSPSQLGKISALPLFDDLEGEPIPTPRKDASGNTIPPETPPPAKEVPKVAPASLAPIHFLAPARGLPQSEILIKEGRLEFLDRHANSRATITSLNLEYTPARRAEDGRLHLKISALYSIPSKGRRDEPIRIELFHGPDGFVVEEAVAEQSFIMGLQDALQNALREDSRAETSDETHFTEDPSADPYENNTTEEP